jgi:hypothetical protein
MYGTTLVEAEMRTFKCYWTLLRRQCYNAEFGTIVETSDYWMIYRGPGFLAVIWFVSSPTDLPHLPSASCPSFSVFLHVLPVKLTYVRGGKGVGWEAKSNDREKAWPSNNHSILSGWDETDYSVERGDCLFQECGICGKSKVPFPLPFFHSLCFKFIFLHFFLKLVSNVGSSCRMSLKDYFILED